MIRTLALLIGTLLISALPIASEAHIPQSEEQRIENLLHYIESSDALFFRNNKTYNAKEAAAHLRWKLSLAGDQVKNADDFIDLIASKSYSSNKPYLVKFEEGNAVPAGQWLHDHLRAINAL